MSVKYPKFPAEILPSVDWLIAWANAQAPEGARRLGTELALLTLRAAFKERMAEIAPAEQQDGRTTAYSVRLVLHNEANEIEWISRWQHGLQGLGSVWRYVEGSVPYMHQSRGLTAPPAELTYDALSKRENTARVSMSRKQNGVAAVRVPHVTMTGGVRFAATDVGLPQKWILRIDVGPQEHGVALDQAERAAKSPLVVS